VPKHIGIAAVSPEGSAECYRRLHRRAEDLVGEAGHPVITVHNEPFERYLHATQTDDWQAVGSLLLKSARVLAAAGAEFVFTPDNAIQHGVHYAAASSPIPWLMMTDLVGDAVCADKRSVVGVVGTNKVMQGATYQTTLGMRGVKVIAPEISDAHALDAIIFNELVHGDVHERSRDLFLSAIERLKARGAQAVIVAFSEASLLLGDCARCPLPAYDAVALLTDAAVKYATGLAEDTRLLRASAVAGGAI